MSDPADAPPPLDAAALEALLQATLPALRAFVRARVGGALLAHESTSDVVQSVCRELLQERSQFEYLGATAFRGWLFTAALNKIHQHDRYWRAEKRAAGREAAPASRDDALLDGYGHLFTPSRDVAAHEELARLEQALLALSESDRELIALAKIAGLPHSEVAARTGKSEAACRQGLRRALVRLAALLEPDGPG